MGKNNVRYVSLIIDHRIKDEIVSMAKRVGISFSELSAKFIMLGMKNEKRKEKRNKSPGNNYA